MECWKSVIFPLIPNFQTSILFLLIPFLFTACDPNRVFDENKELADNIWDKNNKVKFEVNIADSITPQNFYINIRHAEGYPYSNIYVFLHTTFPDGEKYTDTLNCPLADEKGQWLGDGAGDIFDRQILFKRGVRLRKLGTYTFELEQGMRDEKLPLVMDVGIRIEKAK